MAIIKETGNVLDFKRIIKKSKLSIRLAALLYKGTTNLENISLILGVSKSKIKLVLDSLDPFDILFVRKIGTTYYISLSSKGYSFYWYLIARDYLTPDIEPNAD